jgi:hypothetical protein
VSLRPTLPDFSQQYKDENPISPPGPRGFLRAENAIVHLNGL